MGLGVIVNILKK